MKTSEPLNASKTTSLLKKNIVANFAGSLWGSVMGLIFIPLYIRFLGIESWGLIGIFATLQAIFGLLDMGLSSTLNREMARLSALADKEQEMHDLVRTLEVLYWGLAVLIGIAVMSLSPIIAHHWVKIGGMSAKTVEQSLLLMGFVIALQMPVGFYSGGLMGLQQQVLLNILNASISTSRGAIAVLVIWLISPTVQAYFLWQIVISMINVFLLKLFIWRRLPSSGKKAVFNKQLLIGIWRFAAGMSGISFLAVILTQLDKVILSNLLSLEMFGYYVLANTMSLSLCRLFTPVFHSIFPRFTQLVATNDEEGLIELYHKSCQFMAVLILPIAVIIAFFSYEILLIWTQNRVTAGNTHLILSIMICGVAINGLMNPPYALQLAFGWTRLSFYKNVIAVVLLVPIIFYLTFHHGGVGGASACLLLNICYILFEIPAMHQRLLRKEKWRWYCQDFAIPIIATLFMAGLGRLTFTDSTSQLIILLNIIIISSLTFGITLISVPIMRSILYSQIRKLKLKYY